MPLMLLLILPVMDVVVVLEPVGVLVQVLPGVPQAKAAAENTASTAARIDFLTILKTPSKGKRQNVEKTIRQLSHLSKLEN
jgi:hypothetical protein